MATLKDYRNERLRKLASLRERGINPYPAKATRSHQLQQVTADFERLEGQVVSVVGRIMAIRKFGKIAFMAIRDASGSLQLFLRADNVAPLDAQAGRIGFGELPLLDSGDFIEATGPVIRTKTGEVSIDVTDLRLLTKALRPMPTSHDGLKDKEERLRRRYVDTNVNQDVRQRFIRRSNFWQATRDFLNAEGFIEINTPVLEHTTGGADANPFVTHMDALGEDFYLRISHELPLKRLIGGGYEKVYDIGPRFRNENYSDEHLPEHIAFESYAAYQDYHDGMELYERMMKQVALKTWGSLQFDNVNGFAVDLEPKWPVVRYPDIMRDKFNVDVFAPDFDQLKRILKEHGVKLEGEVSVGRAMDSVWKLIRKQSAGPFWLVHEPVEISPLAKQDPDDPRVTQRFHPVIAGSELGNGYSELNDPIDQLSRFLAQQSLRDSGDAEAQMLDIDFVEMLEYGMPPTCGYSYSERFFWFFEGVTAREGVPFPQLRRETDEVTKGLYPEVFAVKEPTAIAQNARPQDFSKKIVAVVDKSLEPWRVANAVAHMTAIIGNKTEAKKLTSGDYFVGADAVGIPRNSQHPIIIKRANQAELHNLFEQVRQAGWTYHVFIKEMQDTSSDQEITDRLKSQAIADTIFYGVSFIAPQDAADNLTKKFQLWQ